MADFCFKRFAINQDRCAMKVGTDGVLLGAWCSADRCRSILDIGTGTGLIALMLAQRTEKNTDETGIYASVSELPVPIVAVEIDPEAAAQARENVLASPWKDRVRIVCADIKAIDIDGLAANRLYACETEISEAVEAGSTEGYLSNNFNNGFDLIVSNPPYFRNSLHGPVAERNAARHDDSLSFEELVKASSRLLSPEGRLAVVLPAESVNQFIGICALDGLFLIRRTTVITKPGKPAKRELLEFSKTYAPCYTETLSLDSVEYATIVKNFLLKY